MRKMWPFFVLSALLCGCNKLNELLKPDFILQGEVFVVTKGAQNIQLGRLPVMVFDTSVINDYLNRMKGECEDASFALRVKLSEATNNLSYAWEIIRIKESEAEKEVAGQQYRIRDREKKDIEEKLNQLSSGHFFFGNLPKPIFSVSTDSSGKYKIVLPKNKSYVVVSMGKYLDEYLFWMLPLHATNEDEISLTLSNDNQLRFEGGLPIYP